MTHRQDCETLGNVQEPSQIKRRIQRVREMDTLMTLEEVAAYLRLSKDTVYRMAQGSKIPASKLGTQWRFRKSEVDAWIDKNKNVPPGKGETFKETGDGGAGLSTPQDSRRPGGPPPPSQQRASMGTSRKKKSRYA